VVHKGLLAIRYPPHDEKANRGCNGRRSRRESSSQSATLSGRAPSHAKGIVRHGSRGIAFLAKRSRGAGDRNDRSVAKAIARREAPEATKAIAQIASTGRSAGVLLAEISTASASTAPARRTRASAECFADVIAGRDRQERKRDHRDRSDPTIGFVASTHVIR
jgi:hypothetical protein